MLYLPTPLYILTSHPQRQDACEYSLRLTLNVSECTHVHVYVRELERVWREDDCLCLF